MAAIIRNALVSCWVLIASTFLGIGSALAESKYVRKSPEAKSVIVLIHGILGTAATTWKSGNGQYFPQMLVGDENFKAFDIFVYDYPTTFLGTNFSINQLADNARLIFDDQEVPKYKDIIFVVHSMGGLVLRDYLLKYRAVVENTRLIYFYSTPTTGAEIASLAGLFSSSPQLFSMKPMDQNQEGYLANLLSNWLAANLGIPSYCAYELKPTLGKKIVTLSSASNLCNKRLDPIPADHITIVKPESRTSDTYLALKTAIKDTPQKADICAPTLRDRLVVSVCNLTPAVAKSTTLETVMQLKMKLADVLSQKELALFPAMDEYIARPNHAKWLNIKFEAESLLKMVKDASQAIIAFDAALRPEFGVKMSALSDQDGVRKALSGVIISDLQPKGRLLVDIMAATNPPPRAVSEFKSKLQSLLEQLSADLTKLSAKLASS
jgi:pimeloyl-ACP methyl ester carboxylesterase